jgi:HAD superfamily hydrolase (TIGR01490 family)
LYQLPLISILRTTEISKPSFRSNTLALALFDLDNTLIAGDSDHAWGEFVVEKGLVDGEDFSTANDKFFADYQQGQLDIYAYLCFALEPLAQFNPLQLNDLHKEFMTNKINPIKLAKADAILEQHRAAGDTIMVITATNSFVTGPIVESLGIDLLIASEGEIINDRYTGKPSGVPSYKEGKVTRLQQWLEETGHSLEGSYFYSDSHNDLPLLNIVDNPVVVDPDPILHQHALDHGWPILSFRR